MTFRVFAVLVAIICVVLFVLLLLFPLTYVGTYGGATGDGSAFMARRASPLFLSIAVPLVLMRGAGPSPVRSAFCWGIAISFIGVALTGLFEFTQGRANTNILIAAVGELLIAGFAIHFARLR